MLCLHPFNVHLFYNSRIAHAVDKKKTDLTYILDLVTVCIGESNVCKLANKMLTKVILSLLLNNLCSGFQPVVRGPPVVLGRIPGGPQLNGELVTKWTLKDI